MNRLAAQIGNFAPLVASALGGPMAGIATSLIAHMFGADPNNIDDIRDAINADKNGIDKIKKLEFDHREELEKIASHNFETRTDDIQDARQLAQNTTGVLKFIPSIIAILFIIVYCFVQWYAMSHIGQQDDIISARVQDIIVMIVSFYFGATHKCDKTIKPKGS